MSALCEDCECRLCLWWQRHLWLILVRGSLLVQILFVDATRMVNRSKTGQVLAAAATDEIVSLYRQRHELDRAATVENFDAFRQGAVAMLTDPRVRAAYIGEEGVAS